MRAQARESARENGIDAQRVNLPSHITQSDVDPALSGGVSQGTSIGPLVMFIGCGWGACTAAYWNQCRSVVAVSGTDEPSKPATGCAVRFYAGSVAHFRFSVLTRATGLWFYQLKGL